MTAYPSWTPAPKPGIVPLHPLSFGTILGRSFTALRRNPRVLLGFALPVQAVANIVLLLAVGAVAWATFSRLDTIPPESDDFTSVLAGSAAITGVTGFVLGLAVTALTVAVQGVVVADVAHGVLAEKLSLGALWRRVRPAVWRLLGYTLLTSVIVTVALGLVVLAIFAVSTLTWVLAIVLGTLCVLGAIPLFLWLTTKLLLVPAVLVLEGSGVLAAVARSWRLTRTRFWPTLGVWVLIQFTFGMIAQFVSLPFSLFGGMLSAIVEPTGAADATPVIGAIITAGLTEVVVLLIQCVALVVLATASTLVYIDARMRHEGLDFDLQSYVDQRQAGAGQADPYRWHVGREIAPRPGAPVGYGPVGYAPPGYAAPGYAAPGYAPPGYVPTGYAPPGYSPPGYSPPRHDADPPPSNDPAPPAPPAPDAPQTSRPSPSPTDWAAPGGDR